MRKTGTRYATYLLCTAIVGVALSVAAEMFCRLHRDTALVCTRGQGEPGWTCSSTTHMWWSCWDFQNPSGWSYPVLPTPRPQAYDADGNGIVDRWDDLVTTNDPCSRNFDEGDRLGSGLGGPNTLRPKHTGVDIQCDQGDPVRAWRDGRVTQSRFFRDCGNMVVLSHVDGTVSTYCHFTHRGVGPGTLVDAGDQLGTCGQSGRATGDHVHLTVRQPSRSYVEYFYQTAVTPSPSQLDPGGCWQ